MAETTPNTLSCAACQKSRAEAGGNLLKCSRCKNAEYCNKTCQQTHWPTHKSACKPQNYILLISLNPLEITNPPISRTLSCPAHASWEQLHDALQIAFGWAGTHTYDFKIKDPRREKMPEFDLGAYIERRRVRGMDVGEKEGNVPDFGPRQSFLRLIDRDPHGPGGFMSGKGVDVMHGRDHTHSQTPEVNSNEMRLSKVFENKEWAEAEIEYEYDFGDHWCHQIKLIGRAAATAKFVCVDGSGHGVAEDAGSSEGWENLKKAYRTDSPSAEQLSKREWFEKKASNKDPKGLAGSRAEEWDMQSINLMLSVRR